MLAATGFTKLAFNAKVRELLNGMPDNSKAVERSNVVAITLFVAYPYTPEPTTLEDTGSVLYLLNAVNAMAWISGEANGGALPEITLFGK